MGGIQGWHLVIIVALALLLFGAPKLPGLARSAGQSLRIFKSEIQQMKDDDGTEPNLSQGTFNGEKVNPEPSNPAPDESNTNTPHAPAEFSKSPNA